MLAVMQGQAQALDPFIPELIRSAGAAGILLALMFVTGWVVAGKTSQRWEDRYDRVRDQLKAKDDYLIEEIVPLLVRAVEVIGRHTDSQGRDE